LLYYKRQSLFGWALVAGVLGFFWTSIAALCFLPSVKGLPGVGMLGGIVATAVAFPTIVLIRYQWPRLEIVIWRGVSSILCAHAFLLLALAGLMIAGNGGFDLSKAAVLSILGLSAIVGLLVGITLNFGLPWRLGNEDHVISAGQEDRIRTAQKD
jgi:hypothetical protein